MAQRGTGSGVKFKTIIGEDEDGVFVAECPSLPGCVSQGKIWEEAIRNIRDAIKWYLASLKKHNAPVPPSAFTPLPCTSIS